MSGLIAAGVIGAGASLAAAKMSADGAKAGGEAAARGAMEGAVFGANIARDQRMENRVAASPYMAAGRNALSNIGMLMGWGNLATEGGDDDWRFMGPFDPAKADAQQVDQRRKLMEMAGVGSNLPTAPSFARLNVPTTFEADPGYAFRQAEGQKALERGAAARGKLLSGEQFKSLSDFNSGLASQEYGNWWDRYTGGTQFNNAATQQEFSNATALDNTTYGRTRNVLDDWYRLAGMGQGSTSNVSGTNSGLTGQTANAFAQAGIAGGRAQGAGEMASGNAWASGIGAGFNNALTAAYLGGAFGKSSYGSPNPNLASVGGQPMSWYRG